MDLISHKKKFMRGKDAAEFLGVSQSTLRRYDKDGRIQTMRTNGNQRLYDVSSFNEIKKEHDNEVIKKKVCYCRVISDKYQSELDDQVKFMKGKYPGYEIITDICTGLEYNKPGLAKIIDYAVEGMLDTLVIINKDVLCRAQYNLIKYILVTYSSTNIIIDIEYDNIDENLISNDIIQITNKYYNKTKKSKDG